MHVPQRATGQTCWTHRMDRKTIGNRRHADLGSGSDDVRWKTEGLIGARDRKAMRRPQRGIS
jgi:hypothetical protein